MSCAFEIGFLQIKNDHRTNAELKPDQYYKHTYFYKGDSVQKYYHRFREILVQYSCVLFTNSIEIWPNSA